MKKALFIFVISLYLCLSCGVEGFAKKLAALPHISNPVTIDILGNELYVLDDVMVYVYSLKDFRLLRKFGKKGEGNGALTRSTELPIAMSTAADKVYLNSQTKMILFSTTGKIIKELAPPFSFQTLPFGKNYVSTKIVARRRTTLDVTLYNSQFKAIKSLYSRERFLRSRQGKLSLPPELIITRSTNDKLFVFDQKKGFFIHVFDIEGNPLPPIKMDYPKIKVTLSFQKNAEAWYRAQPAFRMAAEELREMIFFPDYLPVIRNFIAKNQKLYIQTYYMENNLSEFFILSLDGKPMKKLFLPGFSSNPIQFNISNIFTFFNKNYYFLIKKPNDWELHVEEIK